MTVNNSRITNLELWKTDIDSDQKTQDALIEANKTYINDVDKKIDAKVIEAGGVPFDLEPIKDSNNAVFSGGVHKYIENKFVVMTEDEYNELVLKNPETFYFILE